MREQNQSGPTTKATPSSPSSPGTLPRFYRSLAPISRRDQSPHFRPYIVGCFFAVIGASFQSETSLSQSKSAAIELANRCIFGGSSVKGISSHLRFVFSLPVKINRKPELLETLVSHSKQRIGTPINRKLFQGSYTPFFIHYSPSSGPNSTPFGLGGTS
jgi:hypothetical protein